jgi:hypothetical protein
MEAWKWAIVVIIVSPIVVGIVAISDGSAKRDIAYLPAHCSAGYAQAFRDCHDSGYGNVLERCTGKYSDTGEQLQCFQNTVREQDIERNWAELNRSLDKY